MDELLAEVGHAILGSGPATASALAIVFFLGLVYSRLELKWEKDARDADRLQAISEAVVRAEAMNATAESLRGMLKMLDKIETVINSTALGFARLDAKVDILMNRTSKR